MVTLRERPIASVGKSRVFHFPRLLDVFIEDEQSEFQYDI